MLCRHCNRAPVSRPRGLCYHCYFLPGVRELYPTKYVAPRFIVDGFGRFPPPHEPTAALPGTPEKVDVLHLRAKLRCQLWHPNDATPNSE